ncbi:MAG TPA: hypothetical protein VH437_19670 [Terriglobales bacterium]|jgi:site-specific recombinase XerC
MVEHCGDRRTGEGLSARTVLHIHRLLRKVLEQAVIWQPRPTNPADAVQTPRPEDKKMQPIDEDRAVLLIESAENTEMYIPNLTGLLYGLASRRTSRHPLDRSRPG